MTEDREESGRLASGQKTAVALVLLVLVAGLAWKTMEADRVRTVVMIVLGAFALRLLLGLRGPRVD